MTRDTNNQRLIRMLLTGAIVLNCVFSFAQRKGQWPSELWHDGKIVLVDGDTLKGLIKYDFAQNLVQYVINDKQAEVYTARKVLFFEIFDETAHRYRKFFVLPYLNESNYKTPMFFELLEEGNITLLSRDVLEYKTYNTYYGYGGFTRLVETPYFYFLNEDGSIEDFKGNKNDLVSMMGNHRKNVEKYIKANRLDFDEKYDVAKIVAYYNSLTGT